MENGKKNDTITLVMWTVALIATLGSLFYSEVMRFIPCDLCWYQRILMYPLVVIYGVAAFQKNIKTTYAGAILSGIGMIVSTYHYLVQKLPSLQEVGESCGIVPCNAEYVNYLGFITIPFMAATAFIIIFVLNIILIKHNRGV